MKIENQTIKKTKKINKEIETHLFQNSNIKLARFYNDFDFKHKIILVILLSFVIGTLTLFFIKNTGLYSMGVTSLTQGLSRLITSIVLTEIEDKEVVKLISNLTFWFFVVIVNFPFLIFSYYKVGKKFTILTGIYLVSSSIFSFSLSCIPGIQDIRIFGDVSSEYTNSENGHNNNIVFLTWGPKDAPKVISLFFYAIAFPFIGSVFYSIVYILGASTAGSDIVSIYFFKKKLKSLSNIVLVINSFFLIIGYLIGSYISIGIYTKESPGYNPWDYKNIFGPNLICSFLISVIFCSFLNKLYPRYKIVGVRIIGSNIDDINKYLDQSDYIHNRTITKAKGSYSGKEILMMDIYCFYFELADLISSIREIDNKIFITIYKDIEVNGRMSLYKFID